MVWSVKYRRKILTPEVEKYLQELVQQIADDKGFTVHLFECGEGILQFLVLISSAGISLTIPYGN
jgi:REP element-mobilizing transposase RayT